MGYTIEAIEKRRRIIRIILFVIIFGTTPFYCVGFLLWGTAKPRGATVGTPVETNTPIGNDVIATNTLFPTLTPLFGTPTGISPLLPTPLQYIPPGGGSNNGGGGVIPPSATPFVQPVIPTAAPTLTPFPTNAPPPTLAPPTNTLLPIPTDTPIPIPTDTPVPPPTDEPPPTDAPIPTDTPIPFDVPTDEPPASP